MSVPFTTGRLPFSSFEIQMVHERCILEDAKKKVSGAPLLRYTRGSTVSTFADTSPSGKVQR